MAITFHSDVLRDISVKEERGKIISLTRTGIAEGISSSDFSGVLDVLASTNLSTYNTYPSTYQNLRLVGRTVEMLPNDNTRAMVTLEYVSYGDDGMNFTWKVSSSLTQIETARDRHGNSIYVQHTWSTSDPDTTRAGITETRGEKVPILQPSTTLIAQGIMKNDAIAIMSNSIVSTINAYYWMGGVAGSWMCQRADAVPHDLTQSPKWWDVTFEFQYNDLGWNPAVYMRDEHTDGLAYPLVPGVNYKTVDIYRPYDYGRLFGVA